MSRTLICIFVISMAFLTVKNYPDAKAGYHELMKDISAFFK